MFHTYMLLVLLTLSLILIAENEETVEVIKLQ
jgi:hypothetical protein